MTTKEQRRQWLTPDTLGFAAHWAWIWCVFWSSRFYNAGAVLEPLEVPGATTLEPLWVLSLFANVVGLAALLLLARVRNPLSELRSLPVEAGVLTAAGTLCVSFFPTVVDASAAATVYALGAVLTGVGSAGVVMLWGERLVGYGPRRLMRCFVGAIFAGAVGYSALTLVPGDISQFAVAALPLAGMGLYVYQGRRRPRVPQQYRNVAVHSRPPVPMMLVAAGFLLLPLHEPWYIVGTAVYQFGYQYFYIVLWAIWAVLANREKVPAAWMAAWGLLSIQIGQLIGSLVGDAALGPLVDEGSRAAVSAAVIFAALMVSLFVFGDRSAATGWGSVRPMEEEPAPAVGRSLDDACAAVAHRGRLTARENDVFCLLARGRNRAFICQELVIGDETVKSHVKAIYRKLEVHSQQELINLVEEERTEG